MLKILPPQDQLTLVKAADAVLRMDGNASQSAHFRCIAACMLGQYTTDSGNTVHIGRDLANAMAGTVSYPPNADLPQDETLDQDTTSITEVHLVNTTTLAAAKTLADKGHKVAVLNFTRRGMDDSGAVVRDLDTHYQEMALIRATGLYDAIDEHPMYSHHDSLPHSEGSHWCLYTPDCPVISDEIGNFCETPWKASVVSCAAPYGPDCTPEQLQELLSSRAHRILEVMRAHGHTHIVLGAWGCGGSGCDPSAVATAFLNALKEPFDGVFKTVVFAVPDITPRRELFNAFAETFGVHDSIGIVNNLLMASGSPEDIDTMLKDVLQPWGAASFEMLIPSPYWDSAGEKGEAQEFFTWAAEHWGSCGDALQSNLEHRTPTEVTIEISTIVSPPEFWFRALVAKYPQLKLGLLFQGLEERHLWQGLVNNHGSIDLVWFDGQPEAA